MAIGDDSQLGRSSSAQFIRNMPYKHRGTLRVCHYLCVGGGYGDRALFMSWLVLLTVLCRNFIILRSARTFQPAQYIYVVFITVTLNSRLDSGLMWAVRVGVIHRPCFQSLFTGKIRLIVKHFCLIQSDLCMKQMCTPGAMINGLNVARGHFMSRRSVLAPGTPWFQSL
jgi:hypothetical protein